MNHDFLCSKEEAQRCWTAPERLKLTNDPQFTKYACKNYIIDDDKTVMMMTKVTSLMDHCLLMKRKRCQTSTIMIICRMTSLFYYVEGKGCTHYNDFDAEGNNATVDPVCDVFAASKDEEPEQSMYGFLSKNNEFLNSVCNLLAASNDKGPTQCIEITTPDVPMNLRKSPPEQLIHQSTTPNMSLTFDLQESSPSKESEESDTESQLDAKYEANTRALGYALCNWQFEKCYLSKRPPMRCQITNGCSNFAHKRCSILWSRTHG
jgi:hypothetical protein